MPNMAEAYSINLLSEENVKKFVLPSFGLENSNITSIKFKDTDKQRAVYKIENETECLCLKKVYFQKEDLLFIYSAMEWFSRNNINVPKILPTLKRERFVNYEGMLFILTPWVTGVKCDYDTTDHLLSSSSNLAKMHLVSSKFRPISGSKIRTSFDDIYISSKKHFEQLLTCSNMAFKHKDNFSKLFLENFQDNLVLSQLSLEVAATINVNNLNSSLCHMDYVNKNLIIDDKNNIWVIDFDKCSLDYSVHDVSYFLRRLMKREGTLWNLELVKECLNVYDAIRPQNIDEYKYILVYLTFPQKYWKISRDYYNNIKKCNKAAFYTLLSKACEKSNEQLTFANGLKQYIDEKFK
ncbi:MAG: CotS family spore coat protein [Clostridiaceae bacterium]|nr:CotS family spore coat protein [Clostridiaceae bacterium]